MLAVLVALMARLPPLERGVSTDRLARWHAMGGRYVIGLIVSHAVLIISGYAASVHEEAPGVVSVYLTGRRLKELRIWHGQFFRWRFLTRDLWWSSHPYSLSGWSLENCLRITVKDRGDHSGALARLRPGTRRKVLLLAGGVGITPLRTMFESMPGEMTLVYRASSPADVVFRRELDAVAAGRGTAVQYLLGSRARLGRDLRGPAGVAEAAVTALQAAAVPRRRIRRESFEL